MGPGARGWLHGSAAGYVLLVFAIAVAAAVTAYLASPGGGPSAADTVRDYYNAISRGGAAAGDPFLAPAVREGPARDSLPFSQVAGLTADDRPPLSNLRVSVLDESGGWAQVRATGTAATADGPGMGTIGTPFSTAATTRS